jgi:hypothetical protein
MGVRIKMALSAAGVIVLAFAVSGYARALPSGAQNVAHTLIGAPAPGKHAAKPKHHPNPHANSHAKKNAKSHRKNGRKSGTPVGPDATGAAAYGLCNAYKHSHQHGNSMGHSIAMRNLARAAGGAQHIAAYCASVPRPSSAASDEPEPSESAEPSAPEPSETD